MADGIFSAYRRIVLGEIHAELTVTDNDVDIVFRDITFDPSTGKILELNELLEDKSNIPIRIPFMIKAKDMDENG